MIIIKTGRNLSRNRTITQAMMLALICSICMVPGDLTAQSDVVETQTKQPPARDAFETPKKEHHRADLLHVSIPVDSSELVLLPPLKASELSTESSDPLQAAPKKIPVSLHRNLDPIPVHYWRTFFRPDGKVSLRIVVHSPGAIFIRPHFKEFDAQKFSVYLYGENGLRTVRGPVNVPASPGGRGLWGPIIEGQYLHVEVVQNSVTPSSQIIIDKISHGYRNPVTGLTQEYAENSKVASCHKDVNCYSGWNSAKKSVARMYFEENQSGYVCTGTLLMDKAESFRNWFLTAYHCISSDRVAETLIAFFNYRTGTCNGAPPDISDSPTASGANFKVGSSHLSGTDFSLLLLNEDPPNDAIYSGWTTARLSAGEAVTTIHHPGGSFQRISFANEDDLSSTLSDWWYVKYYLGSTEGGSSGAPLFRNSTQQLTGQLYGGTAACSNMDGHDWYGRFGESWNDGLSKFLQSPYLTLHQSKSDSNPIYYVGDLLEIWTCVENPVSQRVIYETVWAGPRKTRSEADNILLEDTGYRCFEIYAERIRKNEVDGQYSVALTFRDPASNEEYTTDSIQFRIDSR
ncbi:trypsin-like serine peptidase [Acidobacteriota bacterium]